MKILVVEDDKLVAQALTAVLSQQNYAVEVATDGQAGLELVKAFDYDLLLLDVMLPKLDGISLCRQLRSQNYTMPILLLTGRDSNHDKAIGLDAGADDYVVKPFDVEELVARMRALLRRAGSITQPLLEWGKLQLNPSNCEVTYRDKLLSLTPKEYALLELFLRNSRRVFSCGAILEHLWTYEDTPGEEAVRTHIKGLRHKLKAAGAPADVLETVYGIGYRLKPEHETIVSEPILQPTPAECQKSTAQQTRSMIAAVWYRFRDQVIEQVNLLERAVAALTSSTLTAALHEQARQTAHSLAGSLGTFGFPIGSQLARQLEQRFQRYDSLQTGEAEQLQHLVIRLQQILEQPPSGAPLLVPTPQPDQERPLLLIVDRDRALAEELVKEAQSLGLRGTIADTLDVARDKLYHDHPNVVLLDLEFAPALTDGFSLLTELHNRKPPVPVVVFTEDNSLTRRIEVLRQGGQVFLQKPVPTVQVLEIVSQVLQQVDRSEAHILVVDDDPKLLILLKNLLQPWGLKLTTLEDPRNFWEILEICKPDLLILDVEMPYLSGIELCQVVRNDVRWSSLPVLFLTAHTEPEIVNQVFAAGADDFVSKPIVGPELVNRILNRLERIKLLRQMSEIDPLTRVANRRKSTQDLEELLRLANRHHQPLCFAILDLDDFKQVNDHYGHAMGDAVLRYLGHWLRQSFRHEDVVARWGGEEFIVGLYGMPREYGAHRLTQLLDILHDHSFFAANQQKFQVAFSAGVAEFPQDGRDLQTLYRSADAMLHQAKQAGRDRVIST